MVIRRFLNAEVKLVVVVLFLNLEVKVRVSHRKVKIKRKKKTFSACTFLQHQGIYSLSQRATVFVYILTVYISKDPVEFLIHKLLSCTLVFTLQPLLFPFLGICVLTVGEMLFKKCSILLFYFIFCWYCLDWCSISETVYIAFWVCD